MMMFLSMGQTLQSALRLAKIVEAHPNEPESSVPKHCTNREFPTIRLNRIFRFFHSEIGDNSCSGLLSTPLNHQL